MKGDSYYEIQKCKNSAGKSAGKCIPETWQNVSRQRMLLYLSSAEDAGRFEKDEDSLI